MNATNSMVMALVTAVLGVAATPAAAIYFPPADVAMVEPPAPASEPILIPVEGDLPPVFSSIYGLMPGETYLCSGLDIDGTIGVLPRECVDGGPDGPGQRDPSYLVPLPAGEAQLAEIRKVLEIMRVDAVRDNSDSDPFRGEFVFVRFDAQKDTTAPLKVRVPVTGEAVHVMGYAPREAFASTDIAADSFTGTAAFTTEPCRVTAVDLYIGAFATDCITHISAAGSPIVGEDGAVLGLTGWTTMESTSSGILALALDALSHLPPVENK